MWTELKNLVLFRFCSTPRTFENFIFLVMVTALNRRRENKTCTVEETEAYSRFVRNPGRKHRLSKIYNRCCIWLLILFLLYLNFHSDCQQRSLTENHPVALHVYPSHFHGTRKMFRYQGVHYWYLVKTLNKKCLPTKYHLQFLHQQILQHRLYQK